MAGTSRALTLKLLADVDNFTTGRSQFTPGISVKQAPLTDMSIKGDPGFTPFDNHVGSGRTDLIERCSP